MPIDRTEILSTWLKLTPAKMVLTAICLVIGYLGYYVRDEVKTLVNVYVQDVQRSNVPISGTPTNFSLPTMVKTQDQVVIQSLIKDYMRKKENVGAVFMYEFVPRGNEILYQGRVVVTHVSKSGIDLAKRYNQAWMPMNSDKRQVEKLIKGEVFIRDIETTPTDNKGKPFTKQNIRLVKQDGYSYVISVPIVDSSFQVRGYLSSYLLSKPVSYADEQRYISDLEYEANELSRFL